MRAVAAMRYAIALWAANGWLAYAGSIDAPDDGAAFDAVTFRGRRFRNGVTDGPLEEGGRVHYFESPSEVRR